MSDAVNHPSHYRQARVEIEPIDIIRFVNFDLGNTIKYVSRAGHKGDELEDFRKAEWYLICAKETYHHDPEPYDRFIKNHLLYLKKMKPFDSFFGASIFRLFQFLDEVIAENIERLEIERGIK